MRKISYYLPYRRKPFLIKLIYIVYKLFFLRSIKKSLLVSLLLVGPLAPARAPR
ncbi:hypothetical protein K458DRAFT_469976 [Lentithecium fluviatile CBS 122367]|uniref:Uncharacterized protein n=1 Tax=Lentithecium fluviatile CBS 122367 TaxID=1168545 RepID=A0A6G1ICC3_9PLEO|nr:hypothetical protein K458DRAFT_469976 [Lentithecium fluviatile CBS 122367]